MDKTLRSQSFGQDAYPGRERASEPVAVDCDGLSRNHVTVVGGVRAGGLRFTEPPDVFRVLAVLKALGILEILGVLSSPSAPDPPGRSNL